MGSDDASFVQDSATPASGVLPVARKASGTLTVSPRIRLEQVARQLTETALEAYRFAASARENGRDAAAEMFQAIGDDACSGATRVFDQIASLRS
jgi:hypothetical protein